MNRCLPFPAHSSSSGNALPPPSAAQTTKRPSPPQQPSLRPALPAILCHVPPGKSHPLRLPQLPAALSATWRPARGAKRPLMAPLRSLPRTRGEEGRAKGGPKFRAPRSAQVNVVILGPHLGQRYIPAGDRLAHLESDGLRARRSEKGSQLAFAVWVPHWVGDGGLTKRQTSGTARLGYLSVVCVTCRWCAEQFPGPSFDGHDATTQRSCAGDGPSRRMNRQVGRTSVIWSTNSTRGCERRVHVGQRFSHTVLIAVGVGPPILAIASSSRRLAPFNFPT